MIALAVLGVAAMTSYVVLDYFYGERYVITSTQTVIIENSGLQLTIDDVRYDVVNVELITTGDNGIEDNRADFYTIQYSVMVDNLGEEGTPLAPLVGPQESGRAYRWINVPTDAYEQAQATGEPVTISNTTTTETKPIDALPIAASIGIAMGVVVLAVWAGYRQMWGGATSTLLEHGLHDMTVRDVEIVGHIMELKEFTIPELMKLTKVSKITVWRTVQKLVEQGLVQLTERTKLAANGLGGRGKPSRVYRYVGKTKP
jgi:hypothetical protein